MKEFLGTGVALITPFQQDLSVDETGLRTLVQQVISGEVDFLVPLGTTGESVTLSEDESEKVLLIVQDENKSRLPILVGCGGNDTSKVLKLQKKYQEDFHPDGFLSVTPYYNKPSQEGLYRHYKALSEGSNLPIVLYNVPGRTGVNLLPETVIRLATECSNIIAIKEASGNIEQGAEIIRRKPEGFRVLSGDDTLVLPQIAVGYEGCISVAANGYPKIFSTIVRLSREGDFAEARKHYLKLLPWMQLLFKEGNPVGIKASLSLSGICGPFVRLPLAEATEGLKREIEDEIQRIDKH
jgi:4-hydroxy-tetrahydrodipicolinate synthase